MTLMETAQLLGNFGEFVASIAVLATIIYLAVQVKQAKRQIALSGFQARAVHTRDLMMPIATDPSLASIMLKAGHPPYGDFGLDSEEAHRFGAWCHAWMQIAQGNHYLLPEGSHDDLLRAWLVLPAFAEFWEKNKGVYDKEFVDRMEKLKMNLDSDSPEFADIFSGNQ